MTRNQAGRINAATRCPTCGVGVGFQCRLPSGEERPIRIRKNHAGNRGRTMYVCRDRRLAFVDLVEVKGPPSDIKNSPVVGSVVSLSPVDKLAAVVVGMSWERRR
jgi:hypothetical protein